MVKSFLNGLKYTVPYTLAWGLFSLFDLGFEYFFTTVVLVIFVLITAAIGSHHDTFK